MLPLQSAYVLLPLFGLFFLLELTATNEYYIVMTIYQTLNKYSVKSEPVKVNLNANLDVHR